MIGEKAHAPVQGVWPGADHIDNRAVGTVAPAKQNAAGLQGKIPSRVQANPFGRSAAEPDLYSDCIGYIAP